MRPAPRHLGKSAHRRGAPDQVPEHRGRAARLRRRRGGPRSHRAARDRAEAARSDRRAAAKPPKSMNETRALAGFVAESQFADLPGGLVENCKIAVLDALGAGFVGTRQPWAQRIVAVVHDLGGSPAAALIGHDWRTDVARAALVNGVLIGALVRAANGLTCERYRAARGAR